MDARKPVKTNMQEDFTLVLGENFTRDELDAIFESMTERSMHNGPVRINASHVENVDIAAMQVLSAFVSYAYSWINGPVWIEPSEYFVEAADLLGMASFLGLTESKDLLIPKE